MITRLVFFFTRFCFSSQSLSSRVFRLKSSRSDYMLSTNCLFLLAKLFFVLIVHITTYYYKKIFLAQLISLLATKKEQV